MKAILSEMDLHANLMGMLCPKDNETSAACLRAVLDSHDAMQAQLDAVLAEAVWAMEIIKAVFVVYGDECQLRAQAFLSSQVVTEWRERQKGAICQHQWGTDGQHSNEFCKKCFVSKDPTHP